MAWRTRWIFHGTSKLKACNVSGEELRCVQTALNHERPLCLMWEEEDICLSELICFWPRDQCDFPPTARPTPPRSTWPRVFSHVCAASLTMRSGDRPSSATHSHAPAQTSTTQDSLESQKKERLFFFCLPSGQKHDSISFSISAPRTKNIFGSVGVGGFCGTKCLLEHWV